VFRPRAKYVRDPRIPGVLPPGYRKPDTSAEIEEDSFIFSAGKFNRSQPPSADEYRKVMRAIETLYQTARFTFDKDWCSRSSIRREVEGAGTNKQGSTGYGEQAKTIGEAIEKYGIEEIVNRVERRIAEIKTGRFEAVTTYFVKQEPTSISKIKERRPRIVANMDYITRIACSCFLNRHIMAVVRNSHTVPSKYGVSLFHGGAARFVEQMNDFTPHYHATDKKFYDATAAGYSFTAYQDFVTRQCNNPEDMDEQFFTEMIKLHALKPKIVLSSGLVLKQVEPGVMPSGAKFTIDKNSFDQVFYKVWFCIRRYGYFDLTKHDIASVGDDTLEKLEPLHLLEYEQFQKDIGLVLHETKSGYMTDLEFIGSKFKYINGVAYAHPAYFEKNLWNLMMKEKNKLRFLPETLASYCANYAHSEHFGYFYDLLKLHGGEYLRSPKWFLDLHDAE
jgi:hypothetical protein